jgi:hypothetical protein
VEDGGPAWCTIVSLESESTGQRLSHDEREPIRAESSPTRDRSLYRQIRFVKLLEDRLVGQYEQLTRLFKSNGVYSTVSI